MISNTYKLYLKLAGAGTGIAYYDTEKGVNTRWD
jgi:hypothetical protein